MAMVLRFCFLVCACAMSIALSGCGNDSDKVVNIEPGRFVLDEPSKVRGEIKESKKCSIDTVNGRAMDDEHTWKISKGDEITIKGWAFGEGRKDVSPEVFIRLTGPAQTYFAVTSTRFPRPDVANYHGVDQLTKAGFELKAKADQIERGPYEIYIMQPFFGEVEGCSSPAMILVD